MLTSALDVGYEFISFEKAKGLMATSPNHNSGTCILRHDIDVNVNFALKMAQLEFDLGIRSTYFFMFRSPFYNLSSRYSQDCVEKIIDLGHEIALHGTSHKRPLEMSLDEFEVDCHKGMKSFQENLGFVPCGYRASCFSLDRDRMDILKNKFDFSYDASRMDFDAHPLYGSLDMTGFTKLADGV